MLKNTLIWLHIYEVITVINNFPYVTRYKMYLNGLFCF